MNVGVNLPVAHGWTQVHRQDTTVWFKGYLIQNDAALKGAEAAATLAALPTSPDELDKALTALDGLYAAVIETPDACLAVVDRIASVPLLLDERGEDLILTDGAAGYGCTDAPDNGAMDPDGVLAIAMSGYTIGRSTIFRGVSRLVAGEYAIIRPERRITRGRYYRYRAWQRDAPVSANPSDALEALLRRLFVRLARDLGGRSVVVPLSAGFDSRLIAAGLKEVGYKQVKCFAYGRPSNHEARTSRLIAERLGFPWIFVPYSATRQRKAFASHDHQDYRRFADSLTAVPFEQDYEAVRHLFTQGWIDRDDVVVNGQSGDFNTGNHIPPLLGPNESADDFRTGENAWARPLDAVIAKHYDLWRTLRTPSAVSRVRDLLAEGLAEGGAPSPAGDDAYALFEYCEYENRQSKYTVGGQRVYEYFGLEWRLPLWETPFVEFWRTAPLSAKFRQRLYRETLERMNWGDVWTGIGRPDASVPLCVRPPRTLAKLICAPFGRAAWREVDRRFFAYWIDVLANYAAEPYWRVVLDNRGFRNAISWFALRYLERHGVDWTQLSARAA